jgi:hypothetical protein
LVSNGSIWISLLIADNKSETFSGRANANAKSNRNLNANPNANPKFNSNNERHANF